MQFHLNGYEPGDPEIADPAKRLMRPGAQGPLPDQVDVLIVGCGPAGLTLATQLAAFPDIKTCIVEQKSGPLLRGQADGVACRTMEMLHVFGFAEKVLKEAYWVNETSFWKPDEVRRAHIVRGGRVQDVEDGLSEFPHVILNQARVHDLFLDAMRKAPAGLEPHYSLRLVDIEFEPATEVDEAASHPLRVTLERLDVSGGPRTETIRARYVVGCDGARSQVRKRLGRELRGESANQAWGVMDVLAVTDFPDIRLKAVIQSADQGSIVLIPREGGYLTRIYVELDKLKASERVSNQNITVEQVIGAAQRVLHPHSLEVKEVAWWSVYEIGQRLCDKFDDVPEEDVAARTPRVFIAGDACHTHSPKAGQGMNVSMQDAFNLGWKLASVLKDRCPPQLLHTYSAERRAVAKELIDFDREWTQLLGAGQESPDESNGVETDSAAVQQYYVRHGRYTAGAATRYAPSLLTGEATYQDLATGLKVGMRFHSAPVIRLADAKPIHLGHVGKADGRWRVFIFSGKEPPSSPGSRVGALCAFLEDSPVSPVRKYTPRGEDIDAVIDVRAVFQQSHRALSLQAMPTPLLPRKGRYGLIDYEKMFCPDLKSGQDIFTLRGIDRDHGCVVVVRPDQYIANVLPIDAHDELGRYFDRFMLSTPGLTQERQEPSDALAFF